MWIAAQVIEHEGTLLHDDGDFDNIAKVRPLAGAALRMVQAV